MQINLLVALMLLFQSVSHAQTSNWIYIATNKDGTTISHHKDATSNDEAGIKVWLKSVDKVITVKKQKYQNTETKSLFLYNCESKQYKLLKVVTYSSNGKVLDDWSENELLADWVDIIPDSMGETMSRAVCKYFNQ